MSFRYPESVEFLSDPVADRFRSIRQLYFNYGRRARRARRTGWIYVGITFLLLGAAIGAVIYAPFLTRLDIEASLNVQTLIHEKRDQLAKVETEIEAIQFADLYAVAVGNDGRAVAVGRDGTLLRSDRNRNDWRYSTSNTTNDLNAVAFSRDGKTAIAVGDRGILRVSDGGNWDSPKVTTKKHLNAVTFGSGSYDSTAIVVGNDGTIQMTEDAGMTWEVRATGLTTEDLNAVAFVGTTNIIIAVGDDGTILVSNDRGQNWTSSPSPTDRRINAVISDNRGTVLAVGDNGVILVSANRGTTWSSLGIKETNDDFVTVALSADFSRAIAVGEDGLVSVSTAPFTKWNTRDRITTDDLNTVALNDIGRAAIAAGRDGTILVTNDGGTIWHEIDTITPNDILAMTFDGEVAVYVGENSTILRSEFSDGRNLQDMKLYIISNEFEVSRDRRLLASQRDRIRSSLNDLESYKERLIARTYGTEPSSFPTFLFQTNSLRVAIIVILMFLGQHMMVLARYNFKLSEFYSARRSVILLTTKEALPWSTFTPEEFDHVVRTLSPEGLEYGVSPKSVTDMVVHLVKSVTRRGGRSDKRS